MSRKQKRGRHIDWLLRRNVDRIDSDPEMRALDAATFHAELTRKIERRSWLADLPEQIARDCEVLVMEESPRRSPLDPRSLFRGVVTTDTKTLEDLGRKVLADQLVEGMRRTVGKTYDAQKRLAAALEKAFLPLEVPVERCAGCGGRAPAGVYSNDPDHWRCNGCSVIVTPPAAPPPHPCLAPKSSKW